MISKFDTIYESLLNEMMPMSFDDYGAVEGVIDVIVGNIMAARGNQGHWSKAFTSKKLKGVPDENLETAMRDMVTDVVHQLFPENGHTYGPDLTAENFKEKIQNAIKKSFDVNSTYSKFLSDRFANKELLGKAKEVMEVVAAAGIEAAAEPSAEGGIKLAEVPKQEKTQTGINKALKRYLAAKGQGNKSVWSKTKEQPQSQAPAETNEPEEEKQGTKVYYKISGFTSEDPKLEDAFSKLPEEDMTWEQVVKKIGTSRALGLLDANGIKEMFKEREPGEEEEVKDLELGDEDTPDLNRYLRDIEQGFSGYTRKGFGGNFSD
jgi:hypothetical protein